jgi:hypothetical protein
MRLQIIIQNDFGQFKGQVLDADEERFKNIKDASTTFYLTGFEMTLEDGNFIVIPPSIVQRSILTINIIKDVQK